MRFLIFTLLLILFSSCRLFSLKPYRATLGFSSISTEFESDVKGSIKRVCASNPPDLRGAKECTTGGYKQFNGKDFLDPWLEFYPSYVRNSNFGWSYFLAYHHFKADLVSYPLDGQKTSLKLNRGSINPIIYYNFGDKYLKGGKGLSFRFGIGLSMNYLLNFELIRESDRARFLERNKFKLGSSSFAEFSWNWFLFRVEHSEIKFDDQKFVNAPGDDLIIKSVRVSFLYSYYFK